MIFYRYDSCQTLAKLSVATGCSDSIKSLKGSIFVISLINIFLVPKKDKYPFLICPTLVSGEAALLSLYPFILTKNREVYPLHAPLLGIWDPYIPLVHSLLSFLSSLYPSKIMTDVHNQIVKPFITNRHCTFCI